MAPPMMKPAMTRRTTRCRFVCLRRFQKGHIYAHDSRKIASKASFLHALGMELHSHGRTLNLKCRTGIVGVINVTPDSFYDAGKHTSSEAILRFARDHMDAGADILEIGGESTGPGSPDVSSTEERERVMPAVALIRKAFPDAWISVDTYKSDIAHEALMAGADMINDVTAGRGDKDMFAVLAQAQCPVILMHAKDPSARTTTDNIRYDDVIEAVREFLMERIEKAKNAGITQILIDPGLGHFISSDPAYSWEVLLRLSELTPLAPVLVSPSRKSFLCGPTKLPPSERLSATLAASCLASIQGATFIRTHDTKKTRAALQSVAGIVRRR